MRTCIGEGDDGDAAENREHRRDGGQENAADLRHAARVAQQPHDPNEAEGARDGRPGAAGGREQGCRRAERQNRFKRIPRRNPVPACQVCF